MACSKYDEMWDLFDKYDFNIDAKLYKDLTCVICKKVLRNATQNLCGCRYCYVCILKYLDGEEKCCPKKIDDCKNQTISLKNNLQMDHVANKKISMIKVQCPESFCNFMDELRNIVEHVKSHQHKCPYYDIGCNQLIIDNPEVPRHLNEENHTTLLIDFIKNLKSEIDFLKDNDSLKQAMIEELRISNVDLKEIIKLTKVEMKSIKSKMKILEEDSQFKQNLINEMMEENAKKGKKENYFAVKIKDLEKLQESLNIDSNGNSKEITIENYLNQSQSLQRCLLKPKCTPFAWNIENFLNKWNDARNGINKVIYSDLFLSHKDGYSMRLCIYPNGYGTGENSHVSVLLGIIRGEFDEKLTWPMKLGVTIALIDQISGSFHASDECKYDSIAKNNKYVFHKPSTRYTNENCYFGTPKFIKASSLIKNNRLFKNGAILLKCFVH